MFKNTLIILITVLLLSTTWQPFLSEGAEKDYQQAWCSKVGGKIEYVLKDRTRVDCLTSEYAIEFDFGKKWAEAIGQSLYYAMMTGKKPGIVLIVKSKNSRYLKRLMRVADKYSIKVWLMLKNGP